MKPWISVIVPVYNVEEYLERCINSLIHQTMTKIEIILVDDGSTDSSRMMCDQFASQYDNIKVVHKENGGLASARNEGMRYAVGEYVAFVDSDDWMEKEAYQILYERAKVKCPDIISYGYQKINRNKVMLKEHASFPEGIYDKTQIKNYILPDSIAQETAFNQVNLPVQLSACMCIYRNAFLKEHNLKFESERIVLSEDWLFNISCLCRANLIMIIHDIFYNYDTRPTSLSMTYKADAYKRKCNLYKRYKEELKETNNLNSITELRLKNFWLEAVYGCYIIELTSPVWNLSRVEIMCKDEEFRTNLKTLNFKNCSLKGLAFKYLIQLRMHWILKCAYRLKKCRM